jgi:hypothetical protein
VSVVQKMLCEARFTVAILKITEIFLKTDFKGSSCLSGVFLVASRASYLVNATLLIFVFGFLIFLFILLYITYNKNILLITGKL